MNWYGLFTVILLNDSDSEALSTATESFNVQTWPHRELLVSKGETLQVLAKRARGQYCVVWRASLGKHYPADCLQTISAFVGSHRLVLFRRQGQDLASAFFRRSAHLLDTGKLEVVKTLLDVVEAPKKVFEAPSKSQCQIIQLGRYGDLINILPIAKDQADQLGAPVEIICLRDFADLLEGTSYAKPIISPSKSVFDIVTDRPGMMNTHAGSEQPDGCELPYNLRAWKQVGYLDRFYELFPLFDRRSPVRELALVEERVNFDKPVLLYTLAALSSGLKSEVRNQLKDLIHGSFDADFQVIDIGAFRAVRLYDLLGLFDVASVLITVDTAALHLATASSVPTVALLSDHPPVDWRATATKGNVIFRTYYDRAVKLWPDLVRSVRAHQRVMRFVDPPIYHVVSMPPRGSNSERRNLEAAATWKPMYLENTVPLQLFDADFKRMFPCGEKSAMPYLKDALEVALRTATQADAIICLTNADISLAPGFHRALRHRMARRDWCCSFRMDYVLGEKPDMLLRTGTQSKGRDMFAFKRSWLARNFEKFPDFLLGIGGWDYALALWFRQLTGRTGLDCEIGAVLPDIEMSYGFVYHEAHQSNWKNKTQSNLEAARDHNRTVLKAFLKQIGFGRAHSDIE